MPDDDATTTPAIAPVPVLLTDEAAAALLQISRSHLAVLAKAGRIGPRPVKLGRCSRWVRDELEKWAGAGCPPRCEWQELESYNRAAVGAG